MPKVQIPLTGWQQTPDERTGAPRVARLVNCQLDNAGKIGRSPGQIALPTASDVNAISRPFTLGRNFLAFQESGSDLQPGFRLAKLVGSAWAYHQGATDYLSPAEAPRLSKIFSDANAHFLHCGVLECGNGDLVVYAEKAPNWRGETTNNDPDVFGTPTIVWALLERTSGLTPVKFGELTVGVNSLYCYPIAAGQFLVAWYNAYLLIWKWNNTTRTFDVVVTGTALTGPARATNERSQLDACYSPLVDRLFVSGPGGRVQMINASTGALVAFYDVTLSVSGQIGIAIADSLWSDGGTPSPVLLITYQSSATLWSSIGVLVRASGFAGATPASVVYTSPQTIPSSTSYLAARPPRVTFGGGAFRVVLPIRASVYAGSEIDSVVVAVVYNAGSVTITPTAGEVVPHRLAASKPVWDANNGTIWWGYDGCSTRLLRPAEMIGLASIAASRPRAKTTALVGGDPGIAPMPHYQEPCGPMARSVYLPPRLLGSVEKRTGWVAALMVQRSATLRACDVFVATVADSFVTTAGTGSLDNLPDVGQIAHLRGVAYVASGFPLAYTSQPEVAGFYVPPPPAEFVEAAGTNIPNGETHQIVYCLRYESRDRRTCWGPVSEVATYTNSTGGARNVTIRIPVRSEEPNDWKAVAYVFQSIDGVFHQISSDAGLSIASTVVTEPLVSDAALHASYLSRPILYTQGSNGAVSGQLDHFGPPPCRTIWAGRNRILCGGLANETEVHWSTLAFPTEALSWPQSAAFKMAVDEPVTAVAALDDYWFVFSKTAIWVITGEGPDNLGTGAFDDPLRISGGLGCNSWRSVVETPVGLMFQGNDGQIYLIARGATAPVMVSQAIRDSLTSNYRTDSSAHERWVLGAVYDPILREVWFSTHFHDWVLQIDTNAWRQETTVRSYVVSASYVEDIPTGVVAYSGPVFVRTGAGMQATRLRRWDIERFTLIENADGAPRAFSIETNDIDLGSHGRIRRVWATIHHDPNAVSSASLPWKAEVWYDGKGRDQTPDETGTLAADVVDATAFLPLEYCPARQKCNQMRVRITGGDASSVGVWDLTELAIDAVPSKDAAINYRSGRGRLQ